MVTIETTPEFERRAKPLFKKYKSFKSDFAILLKSLEDNPYSGADLGNGLHKVRMSISSKGKGKAGGARVITYTIDKRLDDIKVKLLTIYDKSEVDNVSDTYIDWILGEIDT